MKSINLTLNFLGPYRIIEWHDKKDRNSLRFLRGYSYARWHKNNASGLGRPYVTGTLIRSAVIRAAEELIWLHDGKYNGVPCCPGEFSGSNAKVAKGLKAKRLRRRQTLQWPSQEGICSKAAPCPFCLLLGRYDAAVSGSAEKGEYDVKFSNFKLPNKDQVNLSLGDIAGQRIINRIDQQSGKAEDFFSIWEIEHECCGVFEGKITLSERAEKNQGLCSLLGDALVMVNQLSGSLVTLEMNSDLGEVQNPEKPLSVQDAFKERAEELGGYFEKENKLVHLRMFSDVIRDLRRYDFAKLGELPRGHIDRMGNPADHYIWDTPTGKRKLRDWLPLRFDEFQKAHGISWQAFCEKLGQALYEQAKVSSPEQFPSVRPVRAGPSMQKSKDPEHDLTSEQGPRYEWLITGQWIAKTPFFFGHSTESDDRDHTNLRLVTAKDGRLRLPRSVVRGILRRDLKLTLGTGCRAELGHDTPCSCPVCSLLRKITVGDTLSDYRKPPQIRHRIRLNHLSGTVDNGALFDMEVGPRGVTFPFELRLRSSDKTLPKALNTVLAWWQNENAFLSGGAGTGKGRFCLEELKYECWDLKGNFSDYKTTYGGRKNTLKGTKDLPALDPVPEYSWEIFEEAEFSVCSPFLTKDPIRSLIIPGGNDAVCYESVHVDKNGSEKPEYLLKGESFRGMLRTAVGRRKNLLTDDHEDCDCLLCKLFGNEHEAGKVRVEDLLIQGKANEKLIDRVAIDRFTGGAKDKHKFDMVPLVGTPNNLLNFKGKVWISRDLGNAEREALREAFDDIHKGRYPLGGLGNVGLGWVSYLNAETDSAEVWETPDISFLTETFQAPTPDTDKIYWPHYFLPFGPKVERENTPPGHHFFDEKLCSGKLVCSLRTLTPLIIPDTGADENPEIHKAYDFFGLNDERCIPGSEIKGMISTVFEALTNSCLRVFDEKKRLSWRMEADKDVLENFKPGRVTKEKNGFMMEEMKEIRYPFYDIINCPARKYFELEVHLELTENSLKNLEKKGLPKYIINKLRRLKGRSYKSEKSFLSDLKKEMEQEFGKYKAMILRHAKNYGHVPYYTHPTPTDQRLLSLVASNRRCLHLDGPSHYRIIKHRPGAKPDENFMFVATPSENREAYTDQEVDVYKDNVEGYLKLTGPNKVEKENVYSPELPSTPENMNSIFHNCAPRLLEVTVRCGKKQEKECKRKRLIPEYACSDQDENNPGKGVTYSMTKRCERVFIRDKGRKISVSEDAIRRFEILVEEYRRNAKQQKTPPAFQTLLPDNDTINHDDLVYFQEENKQVVEIIPVRISRTVDNKFLAEKLSDDLRPCVREVLDEEAAKQIQEQGVKEIFQHHPDGLCPACSLFGTSFYKGRAAFGFAFPKAGEPNLLNDGKLVTLPLLERPRPTWSMPDKTHKVPGRKFYVHHQGWNKVLQDSKTGKTDQTPNNRSVQAVDKDQEFRFEIRFENLRDWELGLLIYALQLEPQFAHKLGMAKAFGFGSVKIEVEAVHSFDKNIDPKTIIMEAENKLKEIWGEKIGALDKLFSLLCYQADEKITVRYPGLRKEDDPNADKKDGYMELAEASFAPQNRRNELAQLWKHWAFSG